MSQLPNVDIDIDELLEFLGVHDDEIMLRLMEEEPIDTEYVKKRLESWLE